MYRGVAGGVLPDSFWRANEQARYTSPLSSPSISLELPNLT